MSCYCPSSDVDPELVPCCETAIRRNLTVSDGTNSIVIIWNGLFWENSGGGGVGDPGYPGPSIGTLCGYEVNYIALECSGSDWFFVVTFMDGIYRYSCTQSGAAQTSCDPFFLEVTLASCGASGPAGGPPFSSPCGTLTVSE
jgi:hypothetical protein